MTNTPEIRTEKAYFGMGCFWSPQYFFDSLAGVVATRVGYSGGSTAEPSYYDLADHTETLEVEFDPSEISYAELLKYFWNRHDWSRARDRQYRSVIYAADSSQAELAEKSRANLGSAKIKTVIEPFLIFWPAEEYHQKYLAKRENAGLPVFHCD